MDRRGLFSFARHGYTREFTMNPFRTPLDPPPKAPRLPIRPQRRPDLTIEQILDWCDAFQKRFGRWPTRKDGPRCLPDTTWLAIDTCLTRGSRGLNPGSSLAKLLFAHRGRRNHACLPPFTPALILKWADDHHARTGEWPNADSGPIVGVAGETWAGVESALRAGGRCLRGRSSLAQLLAAKRGVRNIGALSRLTTKQILAWADKHHAQNGEWPTTESGAVLGVPGETWSAVNAALILGNRGLPGSSSLAKLLLRHRGRRHKRLPPKLTVEQILGWADAHHKKTGQWPKHYSGEIPNAPEGLTWTAVNLALSRGMRGLAGGISLAELLKTHRGVRNKRSLPKLTKAQILVWADDHYQRTEKWPKNLSGPIAAAAGETWARVEAALSKGERGLPGGDSLARLLTRARGVRNHNAPPRLSLKQIQRWVRAHYRQTGCWPKQGDGPIPDTQGETWQTVADALYRGKRGLARGWSLVKVVKTMQGNAENRPRSSSSK